jgi:hypothetical protein
MLPLVLTVRVTASGIALEFGLILSHKIMSTGGAVTFVAAAEIHYIAVVYVGRRNF